MATAAYLAKVYVTGTATTMTGQAMGSSGGSLYTISDASKTLVDPSTAITVKDGGVTVLPSTYSFDYLTGQVTLAAPAGGAVTIDGKFLPKRQILNAYEMSVSLSKSLVDTSLLGTGHVLRTVALGDISGSFSCYDNGRTQYTDIRLSDLAVEDAIRVIDMDFSDGAGSTFIRFLAKIESLESSQSVDGVQEASVSFSMASVTAVTTGVEVDFSIL
jgi:hypothetical protein